MYDIARLIDDHDVLDKLADRLIAAARPGQADPLACRALMMRLAERLATHLRQEADFLLHDAPGAIRSVFGQELANFADDFAELTQGWDIYLDRWMPDEIAEHRAAFAGETADLLTALKLRIAREAQLLYPLALESGRMSFN